MAVTRRLRVLHVVRNLHDGGMERVVADLARAADPATFEMHVMVLGRCGRFADLVGPATTLHPAPAMGKLSMLRPAALAAAIRAIAPDVVHTHSGSWYKVARAARLAGVPTVYTEHGRGHPDPWMHRVLDRRAARLTARAVAVSAALGDCLVADLGVPPDRVAVIPNGIDVGLLDADLAAAGGGPRPNGSRTVVFGTLGRVEPVKGYDVLLTALSQLPADAPCATLLIGGDGSQRGPLEGQARRLKLGDRVRFLGWVDQPACFYPQLDAFVLSSHSEGTSIGLLEAMAAGCAPVVTDVGGNGAVLGPELADWLVPPGDPAALAAKLAALARSPALRRRLGAAARARVEAEYDLGRAARRYADVYRAVATERPA